MFEDKKPLLKEFIFSQNKYDDCIRILKVPAHCHLSFPKKNEFVAFYCQLCCFSLYFLLPSCIQCKWPFFRAIFLEKLDLIFVSGFILQELNSFKFTTFI